MRFKPLSALALVSVITCLGFTATPAGATGALQETDNTYDAPITKEKPVMVIRFNSPSVYYQMPLYNVVRKALQIYPGAFFELVSVIPTTGSYAADEASTQAAHENAKKVMATLGEIGLPKAKYETSYTTSSEVTDNEVHLFVR